jgi:hypothetical protein
MFDNYEILHILKSKISKYMEGYKVVHDRDIESALEREGMNGFITELIIETHGSKYGYLENFELENDMSRFLAPGAVVYLRSCNVGFSDVWYLKDTALKLLGTNGGVLTAYRGWITTNGLIVPYDDNINLNNPIDIITNMRPIKEEDKLVVEVYPKDKVVFKNLKIVRHYDSSDGNEPADFGESYEYGVSEDVIFDLKEKFDY